MKQTSYRYYEAINARLAIIRKVSLVIIISTGAAIDVLTGETVEKNN